MLTGLEVTYRSTMLPTAETNTAHSGGTGKLPLSIAATASTNPKTLNQIVFDLNTDFGLVAIMNMVIKYLTS